MFKSLCLVFKTLFFLIQLSSILQQYESSVELFFNRNDFKFTIEFFIALLIILVQILLGNSRINDCYNNSFLIPTIIQYACDSLDFVCFFDFYNTFDLIGLSSEKVGFLYNFVLMYHDCARKLHDSRLNLVLYDLRIMKIY